jgi:predicted methyltransferase
LHFQHFDEAGFEFVASSEINANPKDQPGPEDIVWRLPPSLSGSKDNPEQRAAMEAIGESDRMTLLFRKPADKK